MSFKVFIHFGPPKSGTSAIQKWLADNRQQLLKNGIYYPEHNVDENGVSSGNLLSIFTRGPDKSLHFSQEGKDRLIQQVKSSGAETLLLSSEFFMRQLPELVINFPDAKFIGYIRFPLDMTESGYNQGIKRNFETRKFRAPLIYRAGILDLLADYSVQFGADRFIFRPYESSVFVNADLVSDFLSVLGVSHLQSAKMPVVNSSYCFEAMEFKRWFNQFPLAYLQPLLDRFLQGYRQGQLDFSLISPREYLKAKDNYLKGFRIFVERHNVENSQAFIQALEEKEQKAYRKQNLTEEEFEAVFCAFIASKPEALPELRRLLETERCSEKKDLRFFEIIERNLPKDSAVTRFKNLYYSVKQRLFMCVKVLIGRELHRNTDKFKLVNNISIAQLKDKLKIPNSVSDGDVYREIALIYEQCNELDMAYIFMKKALKLRPNGTFIAKKVRDYEQLLAIR